MAEHTQGPGMGPMGQESTPMKNQALEGSIPRETAGDNSMWSVNRPSNAKQRRTAGLDVLLTKAAVEFQNLQGPNRDGEIKRDCESLREALGVDALLIAQFCANHERIDRVIGAAS